MQSNKYHKLIHNNLLPEIPLMLLDFQLCCQNLQPHLFITHAQQYQWTYFLQNNKQSIFLCILLNE